jgi:hypothetical protein
MDSRFFRLSPQLWVQVAPLLLSGFLRFHCNSVGDRPWVLSCSSHLPGDFDPWLVGFDRELVVRDFLRHDCLRKLADYRRLVASILVEGFKVIR